jgi:hypothetical protein
MESVVEIDGVEVDLCVMDNAGRASENYDKERNMIGKFTS